MTQLESRHGLLLSHGVSASIPNGVTQADIWIGLHDYAISMWGMPLGELWDLEALATACEEENRWTFFFTSAPLNNPGGIASPPNAVAVL